MEMSIGSLELNRTNPAHVGTKPLIDSSKSFYLDLYGNVSNSVPEDKKTKGAFETYLMEAVSTMNQQQIDVANLQEKVVTDPDSIDIHDVTTAMAKAQMSLNLAQTVIDRLIDGWTELSTTR